MGAKNLLSYKHFRSGAAWIIFVIGVGLYACGFALMNKDDIWREVVIKIADVLIIGVILGYLSNAAQFLGLFKQDLQDIIYGKEFLKQRKDISPLWETVSKQMFKNKFPVIHKDFLKVIKDYFPQNEVSFYNSYEVRTTIEWLDRERGIIKVTDITTLELIAETEDKFVYSLKTWTIVNNNKEFNEPKIEELLVNNKTVDKVVSKNEYDDSDNNRCHEYLVPLEGATKYEIQYMREKIYNINEDYYIGFRAKYIVNSLRVCLDFPDDIDAIFICRGTPEDFETVKSAKNAKNRIEKRYKGIILPRQGYIFALRTKKHEDAI